jgi:gluconokinase
MSSPAVILVMGVSGSGKTTVGKLLAEQLGWQFRDADDFHSAANKEKMHAAVPLTDEDRSPWLETLAQNIAGWIRTGENTVLACSALKQSYRATLTKDNKNILVVYLRADYESIAARLAHRANHFMNKDLLKSQFATLEEPMTTPSDTDSGAAAKGPEGQQIGQDDLPVLVVDATKSPEEITQEVLQQSRFRTKKVDTQNSEIELPNADLTDP